MTGVKNVTTLPIYVITDIRKTLVITANNKPGVVVHRGRRTATQREYIRKRKINK